jgi:hypothetical protein
VLLSTPYLVHHGHPYIDGFFPAAGAIRRKVLFASISTPPPIAFPFGNPIICHSSPVHHLLCNVSFSCADNFCRSMTDANPGSTLGNSTLRSQGNILAFSKVASNAQKRAY